MSETALTPPNEMTPPAAPENTFLDGDAPRLGSTPLTAPAPMGGGATPAATGSVAAPSLPVGSPVLSGPSSPMHTSADLATAAAPATPPAPVAEAAPATPSIPAPSLPSLPTAAPAVPAAPAQVTDAADTDTAQAPSQGDAEHPMAHLMGGTSRASEASQRAAELRAAKKAKAKKVKIFVAIGALVVSAVVGPPLWSWFTNALNEAGTTSTEEPAN